MEKEFANDYYRFLGVERNASEDSILRAFRQKSRQYHPDKVEGNELMKLLTQIKVTLLDPDKKEKYDHTYEPQNEETAQDFSEKMYLYSGRKLSEDYIQKINIWKNEIKFLDLKDNIEVIGEKWIELRDKLKELIIFIPENTGTNEYEKYLNQNMKEDLKSSFKKLLPENIWNLEALKYSTEFWINTEMTQKSKPRAEEYFSSNQFEVALIYYTNLCENIEILKKAQLLYEKQHFNYCQLYCRYLMNASKYCPEPTLLLLKISERNNQNISEQLVCAAHYYPEDDEIQRLMLEKLVEKGLLIVAKDLLDKNKSLKENTVLMKEINSKIEVKKYETLKAFVYDSDFRAVAQFITHQSTQTTINRILTDLTQGRKLDQLPASFKAMLMVLKGCSLMFNKDYIQSFNCFRDALYTYPVESTIDSIVILIQSGEHTKVLIDDFLAQLKLEVFSFPVVHKHVEGLKSSPMLRTVVKYEKNIQNQSLTHFEKAMLYIDLCMACAHPLVLANNLCLAANHLLSSIETQSPDLPTVYAFRNTICDLCSTVIFFVNKYLDPIGVTHFCRLSFNIMNRSHKYLSKYIKLAQNKENVVKRSRTSKYMIDERHKSLFTLINQMLSKSVKVNPLIQINLTLSADLFLVNLVNQEFLEKYYYYMIENYPKHPNNYLFKYYLFEGNWKNWFDKQSFGESRLNCMQTLLDKNNLKFNKIENILKWPVIRRDKNGWINPNNLSLNLSGTTYTSVDGVLLDLENGTYKLQLSHKKKSPPLINDADIREVFQRGLSHSIFSLDQADFELDYFPFQQMRYSPKNLKNTSYLSTIFHADYLLKMFVMDTEVSALTPFEFQNAFNGFLSVLPDELRQELKLSESKDSNFGRAHRFWIEAQELYYKEEKIDKNKKLLTFKGCSMCVKEHLLTKNSDGEYVDDIDDDEDDDRFCYNLFNTTPEKRFAQNFTENYDKIGKYFPIFLRLRELLKLNAILGILRNIYQTMEEAKVTVEIDRSKIQEMLRQLKRQITYPINTESKVTQLFNETLRENGVSSESQVAISEVMRVKRNIRNALAEAETKLFSNVTSSLVDALELTGHSNLQSNIRGWIVYNNENSLITHLCQLIKTKEIEKLSRFGNYLKQNNINLNKTGLNSEMVNEKDEWVPGAFSMSGDRKCYGGVCLIPRLQSAQGSSNLSGQGSSRGCALPPAGNGGNNWNNGKGGPIFSQINKENKPIETVIKDSIGRTETVFCSVRPRDLNTGQSTATNQRLASEVRAMGQRGDDAGHILGRALGGPMSAENLVPQNAALNRGIYRTVESQVQGFLQTNSNDRHTRVQLEIKNFYDGDSNRPKAHAYQISFIQNGNKLVDITNIPQKGNHRITSNPYRLYMKNDKNTE